MLALSGTGIGRGIAIGRALVLDSPQHEVPHFQIDAKRIDDEILRFNQAIAAVRQELQHLQSNLPETAPPETGAFIDVHLLMLEDPLISKEPAESIRREQINAEWASATMPRRWRRSSTTSPIPIYAPKKMMWLR